MMDIDLNKIEHIGANAEGCDTGAHLYDNEPEISASGDDTMLSVTCSRCHTKFNITSPLNLNDLINTENRGPVQARQETENNVRLIIEKAEKEKDSGADVLKLLFGK